MTGCRISLWPRRRSVRPLLALIALCAPGWLAAAGDTERADSDSLPYVVQRLLLRNKVSQDSLSVFIQDVSESTPLVDTASGVPRNPASAMKLLTTFVALEALGPAYTWKTATYATKAIRDGRLDGDLYLKGGGDPFLTTERFWKFLLELRDSGLRHISGDLVIDNSYFSIAPEDPGAFDGEPYRPYNVAPDAMLLNFGVTRFLFVPDRQAGRVNVVPDPPSTTLNIENRLGLSSGPCRQGLGQLRMKVLSRENGGSVRFSGAYPSSCGRYVLTRAISTPVPRVFGVFKALWQNLGGSIEGSGRAGNVPARAKRVHVAESRTLAELIRPTNKFSNNVMSRHMLLTLGAEHLDGKAPGTVENGRLAVQKWLNDAGLDFPNLVLDNGAGLSRDTRISARSLGELLLHAYHSPLMPEFVASLPISAIDGTLKRRFEGEPIAGRLHIKTGTLDNVRAMGGYMLSKSGRTFVIVAIQNYPGIHHGFGTYVQDSLLHWLFEQ